MPYSQIRRLLERGILPKSLCKLNALSLCPLCAFGSSKWKAWRLKDGFKSIYKVHQTALGKLVCVDQLISAQPELMPHSFGYLKASRIWAYNIFLDVFSEYRYGFMMRDTILN